MKQARKFLLPLAVLAAAIGLVACGGGSDNSDEEAVAGAFEVLPGAPPDYAKVSGDAELTRADGGTTAEIELSGLAPNTAYVAHLHTGGCDQPDAGGPHFQFEKGGSEEPPNEIHFEFESDAKGEGSAKATADQEVPAGEAGSIVLHLADDHGTAMAASHAEFASLFVHEGEDHEEGDDHGDDGAGHDQGDDHGGEQDAHSDKIACAELEGGGGTAAVPTIVVRNGEPVGGIKQLEYSAGEQIRFKVSSDEKEEIHVHGYDLMQDVPAGGTVEFDFPADIEGIFEAELEGQGVQILELTVNP
ncbi:MAG TPA: hypothetical protein VFJ57_10255 [Solirubrobacterales bacterium]|nr:hypothetical protein [Solirubrobacterales bacterium]